MWLILILLIICVCVSPRGDTHTTLAIAPFMVAALPSMISAGASVFNGLFGSIFGNNKAEQHAQQQFEYQKQLNQQQQEFTQENMHLQNDLNNQSWFKQFGAQSQMNSQLMHTTPSVQRQALVQAGLNPNSGVSPFSGNVATPSGNTASLGSAQGGSASMADTFIPNFSGLGDVAKTFIEGYKAPAEIQLMQSQARKNNADAQRTEDTQDLFIEQMRAIISKTENEANAVVLSSTEQKIRNEYVQRIIEASLNNTWSDTALKDMQALDTETNQGVKKATLDNLAQQLLNLKAEKKLTEAKAKEAFAMAGKLVEEGLFTKTQREKYNEIWDTQIANVKSMKEKTDSERELLNVQLKIAIADKDFQRARQIMEMIGCANQTINSVSNLIGAVK